MSISGDIDSGNVQATTIPRSAHAVSRSNISEGALKVLYRLKEAGYQGCLVGGGVRDLLLGREPKDFDVHPYQKQKQLCHLYPEPEQ